MILFGETFKFIFRIFEYIYIYIFDSIWSILFLDFSFYVYDISIVFYRLTILKCRLIVFLFVFGWISSCISWFLLFFILFGCW